MKSKTILLFASIAAVILLLFSRQSSGSLAPVGATLPVTGNPLLNLANVLRQSLSGLASTGPTPYGPPTPAGTSYGVTGGQQGPPAPDLIDPLTGNLYSDQLALSPTASTGISLIGDANPIDLYSGVSA
jgi:hypothetical protein